MFAYLQRVVPVEFSEIDFPIHWKQKCQRLDTMITFEVTECFFLYIYILFLYKLNKILIFKFDL